MYAKSKVDDDFKKQYQKMKNPDIDDEVVFKPPKPYLYFGHLFALINEKEASEIAGVCLNTIQKMGYDGTITRIKVEKDGKNKYYFLKHECEKLRNEKEKKEKIKLSRESKKEKAARSVS
jgi:hypothetical protein